MAKLHKVTIETVSKHTGLSRGTISRALNDRPDIRPDTKQRVLEACRTLRYSPSFAARSLATGRHFAIAFLIEDLYDRLAAACLRGALRAAAERGSTVLLHRVGPADDARILRSLLSERTDAALLAAPLARTLREVVLDPVRKRPLAACGLPIASVDCFFPDEREAGRMAVRKLLDGGRRRLLLLLDAAHPSTARRSAGMNEIAQAAGASADVISAAWSPDEGEAPLVEHLRGVDGVAATSDAAAVAALLALRVLNRSIGRDVWVVGQGNDPIGTAVRPALSTVDLSGEECGYRAATTALQRVAGERADRPQHITVAPTWIERQSAGQPDS